MAAVTPASGFVTPVGAVWIGIGAGILPWLVVTCLKTRFNYDDTLDAFGVHGVGFVFLVRGLGFHPGPIGLGIILGPIIEPALVQALYISNASSIGQIFFTGTINIILITITVLSISLVVLTRFKDRVRIRAGEPLEAD